MELYEAWKQFEQWTNKDKAKQIAKRQLKRIEKAQAAATASA